MFGSPDLPASLHGEQIGVAALTMARLQERALGLANPRVSPGALGEEDLKSLFGPKLGAAC